jgi:lysophospholipase L1-like esterase
MAYQHLVSLGSSMAAGPGIPPTIDKAAMRSGRNYPHLLAEELDAKLTDLTVSGATTATVLVKSQRSLRGGSFAPQVEGVPADADLATVTIGGNDLRYVAGLFAGSVAGWLRRIPVLGLAGAALAGRATPIPDDAAIARVTQGMVDIVDQIRERAPNARVVLVDYLTLIGPQTVASRELPLSPDQLAHLRQVGLILDSAFAEAATRAGADLARASEASQDHAIGSAEPWVVGFRRNAGAAPFHPNADGMRAVADIVAKLVATPG